MRFLACAALAWLVLAGTRAAGGIESQLEAELARTPATADVAVIVRFRNALPPSALRGLASGVIARRLETRTRREERESVGVLVRGRTRPMRRLWLINGLAVRVRPSVARELAALASVASVSLDAEIQAPRTLTSGSAASAEWNLSAIGAPALWQRHIDGSGIVVAILDTGVDAAHPDLGSRWRGGANSWFDPNGQHASPYDSDGHGTAVTGLIVGGAAGGSAIGVAPGARWIGAKIFDDQGQAALSDIHASFQWLLDPDGNPATADAPAVVNNSWDLPSTLGQCGLEFASDIATLRAAEIAVVFAAGNYGPSLGSGVSPANNPGVFACGADDSAMTVAAFSSRGPGACGSAASFPMLTAPGVNVRTSDLTFGGLFPDSYSVVSGTSFSAPQLAGAIALLQQAAPAATLSEIERALKAGALDIAPAGVDDSSGRGRLSVVRAYDALLGGCPGVTPSTRLPGGCP